MSAWKSRRSNNVALHSLQSLISTLIKFAVVDFSEAFETLGISSYDVGFKKLTRRDAQSHIAGTASVRITTDNPPASPAVMSPKGVAREVLLTEGTSKNARIVLPTDNCLFQSLSLIILPCHREQLGCTGMYLIGR